MKQFKLWLIVNCGVILAQRAAPSRKVDNVGSNTYILPLPAPHVEYNNNCYANGYVNPPQFCSLLPAPPGRLPAVVEANPLLSTLFLSSTLHLPPKIPGYNHVEHLPLNPYLALLLSHYGKYSPIYGKGRGLYGYAAANNYHNNKPFGAYKIYEDNDG